MGFFNLFKTVKKSADIKADQAAQAIEDSNPIGYAEDDLKNIRADLVTAQGNVAKMKATEMQVKREIKELEDKLKARRTVGSDLKAAVEGGDKSKQALLMKVVEDIKSIGDELEPLKASLKQTQIHLKQQEENVEKLRKGKEEAERDLRSMKAMEQVTKSTEALATVNTANTESSLAKFKDRKTKMQMRLDEANALNEAQSGGDTLDAEIEKAMGNSANDDILASL